MSCPPQVHHWLIGYARFKFQDATKLAQMLTTANISTIKALEDLATPVPGVPAEDWDQIQSYLHKARAEALKRKEGDRSQKPETKLRKCKPDPYCPISYLCGDYELYCDSENSPYSAILLHQDSRKYHILQLLANNLSSSEQTMFQVWERKGTVHTPGMSSLGTEIMSPVDAVHEFTSTYHSIMGTDWGEDAYGTHGSEFEMVGPNLTKETLPKRKAKQVKRSAVKLRVSENTVQEIGVTAMVTASTTDWGAHTGYQEVPLVKKLKTTKKLYNNQKASSLTSTPKK